jgi:hypothetical protein
MNDTKVRSRLKAQLTKFCSELCAGLSKPLTGFVSQMLFGIQSSQDVKLSNIARFPERKYGSAQESDNLPESIAFSER